MNERRDYVRYMFAGSPVGALSAVERIVADDGREHGETWSLVGASVVPTGHVVTTEPGDKAFEYRVSGNVRKEA